MSPTIPLWRGFNILDMFSTSVRWKEQFPMDDGVVAEEDFQMIQELGFNFTRIPMSYLFFGKGAYGRVPDPDRLFLIDRVVEFGQRYGVHVMLAFHRAPGYCVTQQSYFDCPEKGNLFADQAERDDFALWWRTLAERYRGVPGDALSFDLVNEPFNVDDETLEKTFLPAVEAITEADPSRLIQIEGSFVFDGQSMGCSAPPPSLATLPNVVNSVHIYSPIGLTHYECPWAETPPGLLPPPVWPYPGVLPGVDRPVIGGVPTGEGDVMEAFSGSGAGAGVLGEKLWDREALRQWLQPYLDLAEQGCAVHIGELGSYTATPHQAYLDYFADLIGLLDEVNLGYALWNLRGPFGLMDNGRKDAELESFHGHLMDRQLLDVLRKNW
jgi:endoglucanase